MGFCFNFLAVDFFSFWVHWWQNEGGEVCSRGGEGGEQVGFSLLRTGVAPKEA